MSEQKGGLSVIETIPLTDIAGRLRMLADEIEKEPHGVRSCIVLVDWMGEHNDYGVDLRSFGINDPLRALGVLHVAASDLAATVNGGPVVRAVSYDG